METSLLDPEAVLANEAFPRDSPRPDFLGLLNRTRRVSHPGLSSELGGQEQFDWRLEEVLPVMSDGSLIFAKSIERRGPSD